MILEAIFNGEIYPAETVVPKSEKFREAGQAIADIMRYFEQTLSKEDYAKLESPSTCPCCSTWISAPWPKQRGSRSLSA